jgi:chromate transporter
VAAFVSIFVLHVPFPLIVVAAALCGLIGERVRPSAFTAGAGRELEEHERIALRDDAPPAAHTLPTTGRFLTVLALGLAAWLLPLALVASIRGPADTVTEEAWFFSRAALLTFGGAYAVLSYINQAAVLHYGWLQPGQMVVGLGLAETTPGPLIMVVEFVGFVGAFQNPGDLPPVVAGMFGAAVATWATFAPCFLWIFLGAPYIERLRGNVRLAAALSTVTAAVVGVIANLGVSFAVATLFERVRTIELFGGPVPVPVWSSLVPFAVAVAVGAFVAMQRYRIGIVPVVAASGLAGLLVNGLL